MCIQVNASLGCEINPFTSFSSKFLINSKSAHSCLKAYYVGSGDEVTCLVLQFEVVSFPYLAKLLNLNK